MIIVHCCLSCFYVDKFAYQENELVAQHISDGHKVYVIASTETFGDDKKLTYIEASEYLGSDGAWVIRLPYRKILPHVLMRKLRAYIGVTKLLKEINPDLIVFHGLCSWELLTISRYKSKTKKVKFVVDSHTDDQNSAQNLISKYFLHLLYYRLIIKLSLKNIEKVYCVSVSVLNFAHDFYRIPKDKLEFLPVGGRLMSDENYTQNRSLKRDLLGIEPSDIVFIQSGKIDKYKKLIESLNSFTQINNKKLHFLIVGSLHEDILSEAQRIIKDDARISYLGWKSPEDLRSLLCAADIYVQPGSQSATMQMSICCRCIVILDDIPSHEPYIMGNGWLVGKTLSLFEVFNIVCSLSEDQIRSMSNNSQEIAERLLDYRKLASSLYK